MVSYRIVRCTLAGLVAAIPATMSAQAPDPDAALIARARAIHERVITLDTHNDIEPAHFTAGCNYTQRLTTQVNLPKMRDGGLDVSFMIVYVGQGPLTDEGYANAYREAVAKFDAMHRLTEQIAPKEIGLALTPDDVTQDCEERSQGRGDRHRERISDRHRHQARARVLRARRALPVAGAQRAQPAVRLEHRREHEGRAEQRRQPARAAR